MSQFNAEGITPVLCDSPEEDSWKRAPGFFQISPHLPFCYDDLVFIVMNLRLKYNYMFSSVGASSKSPKCYWRHLTQTNFVATPLKFSSTFHQPMAYFLQILHRSHMPRDCTPRYIPKVILDLE